MQAEQNTDSAAQLILRQCIQKVATGPEYSKDLSFEEARDAMRVILSGHADPVQTAVLLVALRMKRETDEENRGVTQAMLDATLSATAPVDELFDIADPYDGYTRGLPASPFLAPVLAACGIAAVCHGVESVGPKYGITARKVLRAAGVNVDLSMDAATQQIGHPDAGWAYVDQRVFCPGLHNLIGLRTQIVKRPVITTIEVLSGPIRGRKKTHLLTGYVHKAYPRVYALLARQVGFDSALIVRGVEGGVTPSLQQSARIFYYHDKGEEQFFEADPRSLGIEQQSRAVTLPKDLPPAPVIGDAIATSIDIDAAAQAAAEHGMQALRGQSGASRDSLVYAGALCLKHLGRHDSLAAAADAVRGVLDSGAALARLQAGA